MERFILGVIACLLLLATAVMWWQHAQSSARLRSETEAQVQLRAAQVASSASTAVHLLFRTIEITSHDLAYAYARSTQAAFDEKVRLTVERLPPESVLQVAVIGADGYLGYSNLGSADKVYLGDREHFKAHLDAHEDRLFVSKPVLGRVSKKWSIQFSRPIVQGGRFAGVLVMSMSPDYLRDAFAGVTLGSDDSLTLLRHSGEFLSRNRELETALGKSAEPGRPFMAPDAPATGSFVGTSQIDDIERLVYWQRLDKYPVTVLLGLSMATAFAPVEHAIAQDRLKTILGACVLWAVTVAMTWLARRMVAQTRRKTELEFVAMNDTLTGLQNRRGLMSHLNAAISRASGNGSRVGLLYVDLDGFKSVNDVHGHAAGDEVLRVVGSRIKRCLRGTDVAARIGGDEFVVVVAPLADEETLATLRDRILHALASPLSIGSVQLNVGASAGMAFYPEQGSSADALLNHADHQMYLQKALKKKRLPEADRQPA